jgi:hypothetical protein
VTASRNWIQRYKRSQTRNLPSEQISAGSTAGLGGNSRLPVRLVNKDSSEVTNDVDNTEHETISRDHCQVRTGIVSSDRTTGVLAFLEESNVSERVGENVLALLVRVRGRRVKEIVDLVARVELDINEENHGDQNGKNDDGVNVTGQESSLETSRSGVENNSPGNQERSQAVVHTSKGFDGGGTTKQEHGGHKNVGAEAEEKESQMRFSSPTSIDNLSDGMRRRRNLLEVDGQDTEEEDLNGGTGCIPKV